MSASLAARLARTTLAHAGGGEQEVRPEEEDPDPGRAEADEQAEGGEEARRPPCAALSLPSLPNPLMRAPCNPTPTHARSLTRACPPGALRTAATG